MGKPNSHNGKPVASGGKPQNDSNGCCCVDTCWYRWSILLSAGEFGFGSLDEETGCYGAPASTLGDVTQADTGCGFLTVPTNVWYVDACEPGGAFVQLQFVKTTDQLCDTGCIDWPSPPDAPAIEEAIDIVRHSTTAWLDAYVVGGMENLTQVWFDGHCILRIGLYPSNVLLCRIGFVDQGLWFNSDGNVTLSYVPAGCFSCDGGITFNSEPVWVLTYGAAAAGFAPGVLFKVGGDTPVGDYVSIAGCLESEGYRECNPDVTVTVAVP